MTISPGLNSALAGIQKGFDDLQKHASEVASASTLEGNNQQSLAKSIVELKVSAAQIEASMKVVETVDEVLGTLLDVKA